MVYLELVAGFVYLLMGGDLLVRGAVALARRWSLSPMLVGVTIVALGTSAPELFVSAGAALSGHPGIAIGNVLGSNIANALLVVGALAVVSPITVDPASTRRETVAMLAASAALVALCWNGVVGRLEGTLLLAAAVVFLGRKVRQGARDQPSPAGGPRPPTLDWVLGLPSRTWLISLFIVVGGIWLPLGANLLVESASAIAERMGVAESIVGLTVVALGTSLPELATAFVAISRRELDVALGNVIGSNVLNILAILGAAAVLSPHPIPIPDRSLTLDIPVLLASTGVVALYGLRGGRIRRLVGAALVSGYLVYVTVLFLHR